MGELFRELCKGPVVVIDDKLGDTADLINKLVEEIKDNNLPVLKYKKIEDAMKILPGLLFSNFIVLDWKGTGIPEGIEVGEEVEKLNEEKVVDFVRRIQEICLAPIFIISNLAVTDITEKLRTAGIVTDEKKRIFVENKHVLCGEKGTLISKIEKWIEESPHIYLAKWWTNEWLSKNTRVFWDLYNLNPNWPAAFYHSFEADGDNPILALRDTLFQLVFSDVDVTSLDASLLNIEIGENEAESLKNLYRRLVYTTNNIDRDIKPGDIFRVKEEGKGKFTYYLNIRPECDTTKRDENEDPELYLLEGLPMKPKKLKDRYKGQKHGIVPWENEIIMFQLDGNDIVRFDKKKLLVKRRSEMESFQKICRVVAPFITRIRQSYSNYLARFGVPRYPTQFVDLLFETDQDSSETKHE